MDKDPMNLTSLRANLYQVVDRIIRTGEPVEIIRSGHKIIMELEKPPSKSILDKLVRRPNVILAKDDEDLIHTPSEWHYDFS